LKNYLKKKEKIGIKKKLNHVQYQLNIFNHWY
jgi:hypothetical protein